MRVLDIDSSLAYHVQADSGDEPGQLRSHPASFSLISHFGSEAVIGETPGIPTVRKGLA